MKRLKSEGEKLQEEMTKTQKTYKKVQAETETMRIQLHLLTKTSKAQEMNNQEVQHLRAEVNEATTALKALKLSEKAATRELADRNVTLKELNLQVEEQSEQLKCAQATIDELKTECDTTSGLLVDWKAQHFEVSGQLNEARSKISDMEVTIADLNTEHDKLVQFLSQSDDSLKANIVELEEEKHGIALELTAVKKQCEKLKVQNAALHNENLNIESDLEVVRHELKQRDEELHSIQNFIHEKSELFTNVYCFCNIVCW
jgi:chromosome segregation ATPase